MSEKGTPMAAEQEQDTVRLSRSEFAWLVNKALLTNGRDRSEVEALVKRVVGPCMNSLDKKYPCDQHAGHVGSHRHQRKSLYLSWDSVDGGEANDEKGAE